MIEDYDNLENSVPHDTKAEIGILGALLYADAAMMADVRLQISKDDFFHPEHGIVFGIMADIIDCGASPDAVLVLRELQGRKLVEECGGAEVIAQWLVSQPGPAALLTYVAVVRDLSLRRKAIEFSHWFLRRATAPTDRRNADEVLNEGASKLTGIIASKQRNESTAIGEILIDVRSKLSSGGLELVPSGWIELDDVTGGVGVGELVFLGARPSMGKSTILRQWAMQCALLGHPVGFVSLEEGKQKIGRNILAMHSDVENQKLRSGKFLSEQDWKEIDSGIKRISDAPFYITDNVRNIREIKAMASVWKSRFGIKLLFIDYLQRIRGVSGTSRYEIVSNTSTEVSDMMKDVGVGGVVAVQLNRGLEQRDDKRPTMIDCRDSGQIEQDADGMILLHREDYFHLDDSDYQPTRIAELIIAKWRDGVRGKTIKLASNLRYQRFENLSNTQMGSPIVLRESEHKMLPREADALAKKLAALFPGQFTMPQVQAVSSMFREMRGTVANKLVDETFRAGGRIDQQAFLKLCRERI